MERFLVNADAASVPVTETGAKRVARKALADDNGASRAAMAQRLTQIRTVLSGNQAAVARQVGAAVNTWNRYEKGARDIDPHALASFCRAFGGNLQGATAIAGWVLLGDFNSLPGEVLVQMTLAYPEVARAHAPRTNRRQSAGSSAPEALQ